MRCATRSAECATALDTVRKFGDDPDVRGKALDLIERGLWSIRDVVGSVLAFHRMPPDSRKLDPRATWTTCGT